MRRLTFDLAQQAIGSLGSYATSTGTKEVNLWTGLEAISQFYNRKSATQTFNT